MGLGSFCSNEKRWSLKLVKSYHKLKMSKKEKREKENLKKLVKFEKIKKNETTRERKRNLRRRTGAKKVEERKRMRAEDCGGRNISWFLIFCHLVYFTVLPLERTSSSCSIFL